MVINKMKKILTHILIFIHAFSWLLFGQNRKKLQKIWCVFRHGGISLCWYCMEQRFGKRLGRSSYDSLQNQLSQSQSRYLLEKCTKQPLISIVVPVYKVDCKWLDKCISSVVNQHYGKWELLLVDDASERDDLKQLIDSWTSRDERISLYTLQQNSGIAKATNYGIKHARGEFIGMLDHDDELTPDALTWVVWTLKQHPEALWLYSDEDLISITGKCYDPRFKPDFSYEYLLSNMFACHFRVYATEMINKVGGLRCDFDGSQDHDLALRLAEIIPPKKIVHIPRVIYHWRVIPGSAAMSIDEKPKAPSAGRKAVAQALERCGLKGNVTSYKLCPTIYQIEFELTKFPKVSIIIPTKNALSLVKKCIDSILEYTAYPCFEIIVINNASDDPLLLEYLAKEESENKIKIINYNKPFNHSEMNNIAVASVDSEFVVFMNNDIEIVSRKWLEQLVGVTELDRSIAVVGGMLLYPNRTVQHGGIIMGINGTAGHAHKYLHSELPGHLGRLQTLQEMSGVTAAMALVRRSSFNIIGGFNSNCYPTLYNDVDMCIRLRKAGFRCIYNPMVRAIHYETSTRPIRTEDLIYKRRLVDDHAEILSNDPFYNPNLALDNEQFHRYRNFAVEDQMPELADIR